MQQSRPDQAPEAQMHLALAAARELLELLHGEQEALAVPDADAIERFAADKLQAVDALQHTGAERMLRDNTGGEGLTELRELIRDIEAANERNGIFIAQRMKTVERELAILHGAVGAGDQAGLYTRQGGQQAGPRSRQITRA